jgi:cardiolipin synthase (CMP-forming)
VSLHWLPNAISIMRLALVPPVVVLLFAGQYPATLILFAVAGISDGLDGFLAKRFGWGSRLGALLDAAADKILMVAVFVSLAIKGLVPWWLVGLVFVRDLWIVLGAWYNRHHLPDFKPRPFVSSKINTGVQICFVLLVIAQAGYAFAPAAFMHFALGVATLAILVSGLDYLMDWLRQVREARDRHA